MSISNQQSIAEAKSLPSHRCSMDKQIEILKSIVIFSERNSGPASYKEIAPLAHTDPTVVSGTLGFWKDIGILEGETGKCRPSTALADMVRQLTWGSNDHAWQLFRETTKDSWFMSHVSMSFQLKKQMTSEELINSLGAASGAPDRNPSTAASLRNLVILLEIAGAVVKDAQGIYEVNPGMLSFNQPILKVSLEKTLVRIRIGNELYAVDATKLKDFVRSVGSTIDSTEQVLQ